MWQIITSINNAVIQKKIPVICPTKKATTARPAREGAAGGQNIWWPDWLEEEGKILVKRLVMGATVKRVEGP